jgi:hypothetical protein
MYLLVLVFVSPQLVPIINKCAETCINKLEKEIGEDVTVRR